MDDPAAVQAATAAVAHDHRGLDLREAGDVVDRRRGQHRVAEDLHSAEGISLPITLLLMLLAFGALIAAGVPVLLAVTSVAATMGIAAPLSHLIHSEPTVTSMIVLIGMAVGVDYSLFYLKREREERAKGHTTLDAVEIAAATSGHSILVSGAAVIGSMAGLFIVGGATFDSLATGAIVVVAVAVIGSVTVLPALLAKLGRWSDRPRIPLLWRVNRRIGQGGISRRLLAPVVRRPVAALVIALTALVLLAVPSLGMKTNNANLDTLPRSIPEVQTMHAIGTEFPAQGTTATVVVHGPADEQARYRRLAAPRDGRLRHAGLRADRSWGDRDLGGRADPRLTLPIRWPWSDQRATQAVQHLRDHLVRTRSAGWPGRARRRR